MCLIYRVCKYLQEKNIAKEGNHVFLSMILRNGRIIPFEFLEERERVNDARNARLR